MISTEHTQSLSDFRKKAAQTIERLNQTGEAEILTVNERPARFSCHQRFMTISPGRRRSRPGGAALTRRGDNPMLVTADQRRKKSGGDHIFG